MKDQIVTFESYSFSVLLECYRGKGSENLNLRKGTSSCVRGSEVETRKCPRVT